MPKENLSAIMGKIVVLLTPLSSEDRTKAISAARTILGETTPLESGRGKAGGEPESDDDGDVISASPKAKAWQKKNGVKADELADVFHSADGKTDVITSDIPGTNKKDKTLNAYVLTGIANLLAGGEAKFTDKEARAVCKNAGCYDATNHATHLKHKGNWFTGSKKEGWTLTAPGMKQGAAVIKTIASEQE